MQQDEAKRVTEVLQSALQMEVDGKEFYQQAANRSTNRLAKELFERLAVEEDDHRRKFQEIYDGIKKGREWPEVAAPTHGPMKFRAVFKDALEELGTDIKVSESELEAIKTAMNMELQTYDLYRSRSEESNLRLEKEFYKSLAGEERGHHLALLDSYEFLTDPAGWFTVKERWTLEGMG
ncbi:MAG: ferritin-like domain-containing protein [Chloroflexota bacterium]